MTDIANPPSISAKSYADFGALGELRAKAQHNQEGALRETAQQFEALFIQMMLKSMRQANSVIKSDVLQSSTQETFQGMYDQELSISMSKRNALGFADVIVKKLSQQQSSTTTAGILSSRLQANGQTPSAVPLKVPAVPMSLAPMTQSAMTLNRQVLRPLPINQPLPLTLSREEP